MTCNKSKESACIGEMRDLFNDFAERLYPQAMGSPSADGDDDDDAEVDLEKEIQAEVNAIRKPTTAQLFTHVRVNLQCGEHKPIFNPSNCVLMLWKSYFSKRSLQ